jgi:hypothetical protein
MADIALTHIEQRHHDTLSPNYNDHQIERHRKYQANRLIQKTIWDRAYTTAVHAPPQTEVERLQGALARRRSVEEDHLQSIERQINSLVAQRENAQRAEDAFNRRAARHPNGLHLTRREFNAAGRKVEGFNGKWTLFRNDEKSVRFVLSNVPVAAEPFSFDHADVDSVPSTIITPNIALGIKLDWYKPRFYIEHISSTRAYFQTFVTRPAIDDATTSKLFDLITNADWVGLIREARGQLTDPNLFRYNARQTQSLLHIILNDYFTVRPQAAEQDRNDPRIWHVRTTTNAHYAVNTVDRTYHGETDG